MIIKRIDLKQMIEFLSDKLLTVIGNQTNVYIDNLADVQNVTTTTLDWINPNKVDKQHIAECTKARVLLVDDSIQYTDTMQKQNKTLLVVSEPKVCLAMIGNHFFVDHSEPSIHPTAIIDPEAKIGKNCFIGPYCVIGKATIGDNCIFDSNVRIYDCVIMGSNCSVKSGAVLGSAGFGFEKDSNGNRFRFPQIGNLIIGNYVEVGANTCIDRGALSDTIIGNYTKINNLCHIAHNNVIGNNVEITGCCNVSGSNVIDDDVWISPNSSIRGWVHIGEGAVVGMGAVVVKDIPAHETWVGNPARKLEKK